LFSFACVDAYLFRSLDEDRAAVTAIPRRS
jgi:hypothetical protein